MPDPNIIVDVTRMGATPSIPYSVTTNEIKDILPNKPTIDVVPSAGTITFETVVIPPAKIDNKSNTRIGKHIEVNCSKCNTKSEYVVPSGFIIKLSSVGIILEHAKTNKLVTFKELERSYGHLRWECIADNCKHNTFSIAIV